MPESHHLTVDPMCPAGRVLEVHAQKMGIPYKRSDLTLYGGCDDLIKIANDLQIKPTLYEHQTLRHVSGRTTPAVWRQRFESFERRINAVVEAYTMYQAIFGTPKYIDITHGDEAIREAMHRLGQSYYERIS